MTKLEKYRRSKNITRKKLEELSGVTARAIENYELEKRDINRAHFINGIKLAKALGVNPEELLEDVETEL